MALAPPQLPAPKPASTLTWRTLILSSLLLLATLTSGMAALAYWAWGHLTARVALQDEMALVTLPSTITVQARVLHDVQTRVDQTVPLQVPIHQNLSIPITAPIAVQAEVDTSLPLDFEVPIDQVLHIDQVIPLDTHVQTRIFGVSMNLPIKAQVPLKVDVPVHLRVPIHQRIPIQLTVPALVRVSAPIQARMDSIINTEVSVHQAFAVPVTAPITALVSFPQRRVQVKLNVPELTLPLKDARLRLTAAPPAKGPTHTPD